MKLATTTGDFEEYTHSQLEAMEYIKMAGFKYLDYNFCWDYRQKSGIYGQEDFNKYIESVIKKCDELKVKFVQAHAPMGVSFGRNDEKFIEDTKKSIDACNLLGIKNIVVHTERYENADKDETIKKNKEFFMPILAHAEKYNINILVENFNRIWKDGAYWIDNAVDLLEFVDYVNHPLLKIVWDTGHGNLKDTTPYDALNHLGNYVYALHVQDNRGFKDDHTAPFFGTLDLDSLMKGLIKIGYDGYFTFEASNIFAPSKLKGTSNKENPLSKIPLEFKIKMESMLYEIGKHILTTYNVFED